jgi:hypothetical protein
LIFILLAEPLAPEVLKKLESYESGRSLLLERIEELSQAIDRLTVENRSTREWFKTRLQLLWQSTSQRDEAIGEAMKRILEHAEEMSRHVALRETGEMLMALLKVPVDAHPPSPDLTSPTLPKPTSSPTTPSATLVIPGGGKKRTSEEEGDSGSNKRSKVGES